jgi:hypothetical protein
MSFDLEYEWADVAQSPDETVHRTMAKLQIRVNGRLVTAVKDRQHKLDRDYVLVPLHQVAEWLVSNWHHLLYEPENSNGPQRPGFESRHSLAFAGDGFILPPLTMAPTDGATVMRWATSKPKFSEIEFTRFGEERVPTDEVATVCSSLIEDVLGRMRQENLPLETLEEAWQGVRELDEEERDFARAAALLGADPFDLDDALADGIVEFWEGVPPSLREDSLGAVTSVESLPAVRRWVERSLEVLDQQDESAVATSGWTAIRNSVLKSNSPIPWQRGYDLAQNFRREVVDDSSRDPNALGAELGIPYRYMHAVSNRLQGLVAARSPACVGTVSSDTSRRFLQARSIGAFLSPPDRGPSLLSTMATDFQAFTRAFAAEFLAPAEQLRARMKGGRTPVVALARDFRVSPRVISHQIQNHRLGFATDG